MRGYDKLHTEKNDDITRLAKSMAGKRCVRFGMHTWLYGIRDNPFFEKKKSVMWHNAFYEERARLKLERVSDATK